MYPSKNQGQPTEEDADYRVFELDHDIPICESASPNSSKRWHTFGEDEFNAFVKRLENEVYDYMKQCEAKEGAKFTMAIAHHSFVNPLVVRNVIQRRLKEGLPKIPLYCFVHGTALKMYRWELGGKSPEEFPMRFHPMMVKERLFDDVENGVAACFVISEEQKGGIAEIFPTFPTERVIVAPNGINVEKFKPQSKTFAEVTFDQTRELLWPAAPPSKEDLSKCTKLVTFVGKYAEWKRQAALLHAAAAYEKDNPDVLTFCVGTGPDDEKQKIIALCEKLGLKNTFLLGPRSQDILAELYTVSNLGVFPSFKEPFGLVFVECMACRTPVIGANSGGPKDFVSPPVGELVAEPPETTDLSTVPLGIETLGKTLHEAITRSLKEDWKTTKGEACYQLALDRFTVGAQVKFMLDKAAKVMGTFDMIFQLGTNNWQRPVRGTGELEFAPGSGVLHEAHHNAYNEIPGIRSYSIYPSKNQPQPADPTATYRVFELEHDIPICESASPNSSKRWHTMSDAEFTAYCTRMENEVYDYMNQCEAREGHNFTKLIAHHSFVNPLVCRRVIARRTKDGKPKIPIYCFVHGTALKMYRWELGGKSPEEFPMRFHKMMCEENLFNDIENGINACFVISAEQAGGITEIFPSFPQDRIIVAPNGINVEKFKPREKNLLQVLTEQTREILWPAVPAEADLKKYTKVVSFVGKFAEWKRQAALCHAAAAYEKENPDVITLCVGTGPDDEKAKIIAVCEKLGMKNTFLLGPRSQDILAEIYTVSNLGVFPSFKEPFGLVFVECMACRTPVIGANSGGPKDFVSPPVGELVAEPPETSDLSTVPLGIETLGKTLKEAICRSLKEDWKTTKADACIKLAHDRFTVGAQVRFMQEEIKKIGSGVSSSFWDVPGMKAGVITGDVAWNLLKFAKQKGFAIPAFNCTTTSSVNAVLEAGKKLNRPIMIQFSEGGAAFFAGKSLPNDKKQASILGAVAGAHYTRSVAAAYGIPVFLHSDHCAKKLLPWFDGMLEFDKAFFAEHGEPLFTSHMLDLSEEPHAENIGLCAEYFKKMAPLNMILEMEIGITGGVEDGVDNSGVSKDKLYSTPDDLWQVWQALSPISEKFTVAAAFGNVHGVYKPGNVQLRPELLKEFQTFVGAKLNVKNPFFFVFHGGSGSEKAHIDAAVSYGTVKMNVDTDTQWAYWQGILDFYNDNEGYLQGQIGNPKGLEKPNKSFYDPRCWVRKAEESMVKRVMESCGDLGNVNK
jgi:fructose-bisphosphate aldolase class II